MGWGEDTRFCAIVREKQTFFQMHVLDMRAYATTLCALGMRNAKRGNNLRLLLSATTKLDEIAADMACCLLLQGHFEMFISQNVSGHMIVLSCTNHSFASAVEIHLSPFFELERSRPRTKKCPFDCQFLYVP